MFGFFVDLLLGMIRAKMAFAAGFRLAGLRLAETMAGMTGAAGPFGAIRIDATDAGIRPGIGVK